MTMRIFRYIAAAALMTLSLSARSQGIREVEGSFLEPLEPRDSILIADQLRYGFVLNGVEDGTSLSMSDWSGAFGDTLIVVRGWSLDTLKTVAPRRKDSGPAHYDISADVLLAPFEAGQYTLPRIAVRRVLPGGQTDTLLFDPQKMEVTTIPVDTTSFQVHDIKGQIRYPLTFKEILPYLLGAVLLAALIAGLVFLIRRRLAGKSGEAARKEPPYIVALRTLDTYRGDKLWAPEKQKAFYSGITDTLREYMADTFGIDAREMTTADIFDALRESDRITAALYDDTRDLFELADFVKFAKHTVSTEELAKAVPSAVRFVTATYQSQLDEEQTVEQKPE